MHKVSVHLSRPIFLTTWGAAHVSFRQVVYLPFLLEYLLTLYRTLNFLLRRWTHYVVNHLAIIALVHVGTVIILIWDSLNERWWTTDGEGTKRLHHFDAMQRAIIFSKLRRLVSETEFGRLRFILRFLLCILCLLLYVHQIAASITGILKSWSMLFLFSSFGDDKEAGVLREYFGSFYNLLLAAVQGWPLRLKGMRLAAHTVRLFGSHAIVRNEDPAATRRFYLLLIGLVRVFWHAEVGARSPTGRLRYRQSIRIPAFCTRDTQTTKFKRPTDIRRNRRSPNSRPACWFLVNANAILRARERLTHIFITFFIDDTFKFASLNHHRFLFALGAHIYREKEGSRHKFRIIFQLILEFFHGQFDCFLSVTSIMFTLGCIFS